MAITSGSASGLSKTEAAAIRANLRLRFNTLYNTHEVFTTHHGSGYFRWVMVTDEIAEWYKTHFNLSVDSYLQPSLRTGGIMEVRSNQSKHIKGE